MALAEKIRPLKPSVNEASAEVVTITPKMAEDMIAKNVKNRNVSHNLVDAYARDMRNGSWQFTGEALKLSLDGNLIDGQHRLLACIKAEVPFKTLVIYDLNPDVQEVIDTGRGRTVADTLHIAGFTQAARTAAACRFLLFIKRGLSKQKVSASEMLNIFRTHPNIHESVVSTSRAFGPSQGLLSAIHYIGAHLLDKKTFADEFIAVFITGNSYDNCAAQAWRERLIRLKAARSPIMHASMFYGTIHAWNLFVKGKDVKLFRAPDHAKIEGLNTDLI